MYKCCSWVSQICIYADATREYGIAIVVPSLDKLAGFAKAKGNSGLSQL
jgi:long-subunit acyl-CoA synthetase (AMP-forming)